MIWLAGEDSPAMAFPPLSQTPFGLPPPQGADPPGYYYGWPLAGVGKRVGSAVIDYVLVWFALLLVIGLIGRGAATAGGDVGSVTALWLFVVAYAAQCWNFIVRQGRSGQSLGKQLMGTRLIATSNLAAPGKAACFARSLALLVDAGLFGIGLLSHRVQPAPHQLRRPAGRHRGDRRAPRRRHHRLGRAHRALPHPRGSRAPRGGARLAAALGVATLAGQPALSATAGTTRAKRGHRRAAAGSEPAASAGATHPRRRRGGSRTPSS